MIELYELMYCEKYLIVKDKHIYFMSMNNVTCDPKSDKLRPLTLERLFKVQIGYKNKDIVKEAFLELIHKE